MVKHMTSEQEFAQTLSSGVVVADFYADWCMPCKMIAPVMQKLQNHYAGKLTVVKINIDELPELAEQYNVMSIPAILFFKNGVLSHTSVGVRPYEELAAEADKLL